MTAIREFLAARPYLNRGSVRPTGEGACVIYSYTHDAAPDDTLPTLDDIQAWLPEWRAALDAGARQIHRITKVEGLDYATLGGHMGGKPLVVRVLPAMPDGGWHRGSRR
ncbi:hypothetical protein [Nocardiopsis sp. YSL2]|uniref:hypothetical protein n=1 Tax=Nocardiopsis sp. YSL2 TaxID=2939492 RepID=UPI0026F463B8|nr:hypothetical protein [Nocardiopsis sp. YSL2]